MGSTYINRVRLQELKSLLLEAQKGPISLQKAIHEHASVHQGQQKDLGELILALKSMVPAVLPQKQDLRGGESGTAGAVTGSADRVLMAVKEHMTYTKETGKRLETLQQQYGSLEKSIYKIAADVHSVKTRVPVQPAERPLPAYIPRDSGEGAPLQGVMLGLADTEQRLGAQINRNSIYSTALTCTAVALTLPIMYVLLNGS